MVLRNHDGAYITSASYFLPRCNDLVKAELHACQRAAILAAAQNIPRVYIESDCREIVGKIGSKEKDLSSLGPIVEEVKRIMEAREEWKIAWVRRDANRVAHVLAREAVSNNRCMEWPNMPPDFILHVNSDEIPSGDS